MSMLQKRNASRAALEYGKWGVPTYYTACLH